MWKIAAIISVLCVVAGSAMGQISREIGGFDQKLKWVNARVDYGNRPFVGTFTFESLPEPLKQVRVNFTLTVCSDYKYLKLDPWPIRVDYLRKGVQWIGDTLFTWPGAHDIGDQLSGSFEVVPLTSGLFGFAFYLDSPGLIDGALTVQWCFDHDGVLSYLGKVEPGAHVPCTYDWCTFFNRDSVHIVQDIYEDGTSELFYVTCSVVPPFRVGDTSTVRYEFTAIDDVPDELDIELHAGAMSIVSQLPNLKTGVARGEMLTCEIRVVPQAIRDIHELTLNVTDFTRGSGERTSNGVMIFSVFRDDGSLRFISDRDLYGIDSTFLPMTFRTLKEGDCEALRWRVGADSVFRYKY